MGFAGKMYYDYLLACFAARLGWTGSSLELARLGVENHLPYLIFEVVVLTAEIARWRLEWV